MLRWIIMLAYLMLCIPSTNAKDKPEGRIGDLLITATGVQETNTYETLAGDHLPTKPGFHTVLIALAIRNVGKYSVCANLGATLEGTLGLESKGWAHFKDNMRVAYINQLLPGETLTGWFEFPDIRDEIRPVKFRIHQHDSNQGCGMTRTIGYRNEITIKLANVPQPESAGR